MEESKKHSRLDRDDSPEPKRQRNGHENDNTSSSTTTSNGHGERSDSDNEENDGSMTPEGSNGNGVSSTNKTTHEEENISDTEMKEAPTVKKEEAADDESSADDDDDDVERTPISQTFPVLLVNLGDDTKQRHIERAFSGFGKVLGIVMLSCTDDSDIPKSSSQEREFDSDNDGADDRGRRGRNRRSRSPRGRGERRGGRRTNSGRGMNRRDMNRRDMSRRDMNRGDSRRRDDNRRDENRREENRRDSDSDDNSPDRENGDKRNRVEFNGCAVVFFDDKIGQMNALASDGRLIIKRRPILTRQLHVLNDEFKHVAVTFGVHGAVIQFNIRKSRQPELPQLCDWAERYGFVYRVNYFYDNHRAHLNYFSQRAFSKVLCESLNRLSLSRCPLSFSYEKNPYDRAVLLLNLPDNVKSKDLLIFLGIDPSSDDVHGVLLNSHGDSYLAPGCGMILFRSQDRWKPMRERMLRRCENLYFHGRPILVCGRFTDIHIPRILSPTQEGVEIELPAKSKSSRNPEPHGVSVWNIGSHVTAHQLRYAFEKFGAVIKAQILGKDGMSYGIGVVIFDDVKTQRKCLSISRMDGRSPLEIDGRQALVCAWDPVQWKRPYVQLKVELSHICIDVVDDKGPEVSDVHNALRRFGIVADVTDRNRKGFMYASFCSYFAKYEALRSRRIRLDNVKCKIEDIRREEAQDLCTVAMHLINLPSWINDENLKTELENIGIENVAACHTFHFEKSSTGLAKIEFKTSTDLETAAHRFGTSPVFLMDGRPVLVANQMNFVPYDRLETELVRSNRNNVSQKRSRSRDERDYSSLSIFCWNLLGKMTQEDMEKTFDKYGIVEKTEFSIDEKGRKTGFGIVRFRRNKDRRMCLQDPLLPSFNGRPIIVKPFVQDTNSARKPAVRTSFTVFPVDFKVEGPITEKEVLKEMIKIGAVGGFISRHEDEKFVGGTVVFLAYSAAADALYKPYISYQKGCVRLAHHVHHSKDLFAVISNLPSKFTSDDVLRNLEKYGLGDNVLSVDILLDPEDDSSLGFALLNFSSLQGKYDDLRKLRHRPPTFRGKQIIAQHFVDYITLQEPKNKKLRTSDGSSEQIKTSSKRSSSSRTREDKVKSENNDKMKDVDDDDEDEPFASDNSDSGSASGYGDKESDTEGEKERHKKVDKEMDGERSASSSPHRNRKERERNIEKEESSDRNNRSDEGERSD